MIRAVLMAASLAMPAQAQAAERIVSLGGSVTEIVYALGAGDRLIARDTTSSWPDAVQDLPDVGYIRRLSAEGVLSVVPDLILAEHDAGPPEAVEILTATGIPFVIIPEAWSAAGLEAKIRAVGDALGRAETAAALGAALRARVEALAAQTAATEGPRKRVLFILSLQGGRVMAAGTDTAADAMIRLSGGVNAVAGVTGYKPLSDEAITAAAPDVILMMSHTAGGALDHGARSASLAEMPALRLTPAVQNDQVVRMNGLYLLGFGPRTAEAIAELNAHLYGAH
jgi:iron complex transport system substrate-binding protein